MYIVLLSGGSGKRLWPLSNDLCSKQYIKLMNPDEAEQSDSTEKCSMLQRVFGQLKAASLSENTIVCASDSQVPHSQALWGRAINWIRHGLRWRTSTKHRSARSQE